MQPQDAFAELAKITLSEQSLDSVMATIASLTKRTVPGASEVSVTMVERGTPRQSPPPAGWPRTWTSGSTSAGTARASPRWRAANPF
jgi:hypothetical protein